eukprot:TRINITY_DN26719_c0_g1_i1.p1 TRINITY_DN26719_c0_g1~~TRINITY_DN26719_c0_g1_i1.p1  ORF type:complete len:633 (-),score=152.98 TRINITY_DN26719_c0_g1_i1:65-1963(-)
MMGESAPRPHLWIDPSLAGQSYQEELLPLPAFLAGTLREIILSSDFPSVPKPVQRKVSHLSFLLHLMCRFDNFPLVYQHYCEVLDDIFMSLASWEHDEYFEEKQARVLCDLLKGEAEISETELENPTKDVDVKLEVKMGYKSDTDNDINDVIDEFELDNGDVDDSNIHDLDWLGDEFDNATMKKKVKSLKNIEGDEDKVLLKCPQCAKVVKSKKWLAKHLQKTHLNTNLTDLPCHVCDKISESLDAYVEHVKGHPPINPDAISQGGSKSHFFNSEEKSKEIFCPDCNCNIKLLEGESLAKHINNVHKVKINCPYCQNSALSDKWLLSHISKHHPDENLSAPVTFLCSTCGGTSASFLEYTEHVKSHEDVCCKICGRKFSDRKKLFAHSKYAHPMGNAEPRESSMCPYCGKSYKYLPFHIYKVHSGREIKCDMCDYTTSLLCYMTKHKKQVHEGFTTTCEDCGKIVKQLNHHKQRGCPARKKAERLQCPNCDKTFALRDGLTRHIKVIHMNQKDKACPHCDYRTSEGFNLRIHIARVHEGKSFKAECPYCNKSVVSLDWHVEKYHKKLLDDKVELSQLVNQDIPLENKMDEMINVLVVDSDNKVGLDHKNEVEMQAFDYTQSFLHENLYKSQT